MDQNENEMAMKNELNEVKMPVESLSEKFNDIRWEIPAHSDEDLLVWSEDHAMMEWMEAHPEYAFIPLKGAWYGEWTYRKTNFNRIDHFPTLRDAIRDAMGRCE